MGTKKQIKDLDYLPINTSKPPIFQHAHPHDLLQKGKKYEKLKKQRDELLEVLKGLIKLIDTDDLVRNISKDNDLEYFIKQGVRINNTLYGCQEAIKNCEND